MVGSVQVHNRRESVALDMKAYSHLSAQERIRIDELRNRDGLGVRQIALRIGRGKSTVSREPGRGPWSASDENGSYRPYRPKRLKAETRAREFRRPLRMSYPPLLEWVMDALRKGWTPERIEGRLKVEWPADPRMRISHECLHRWIHAKPQRALDLRRYLPRGKRHRTRSKGRRARGPRIPMRVPITDRPKKVDSRHEFGHFESDTVVGASPSKRCIDTQVERKSRRLFARFIPDKGAPATARAEYDIHKDIPAPARIDQTWDNGTESSCHLLVDETLGMLTYYADPCPSGMRSTGRRNTWPCRAVRAAARGARIRCRCPWVTPVLAPAGRAENMAIWAATLASAVLSGTMRAMRKRRLPPTPMTLSASHSPNRERSDGS